MLQKRVIAPSKKFAKGISLLVAVGVPTHLYPSPFVEKTSIFIFGLSIHLPPGKIPIVEIISTFLSIWSTFQTIPLFPQLHMRTKLCFFMHTMISLLIIIIFFSIRKFREFDSHLSRHCPTQHDPRPSVPDLGKSSKAKKAYCQVSFPSKEL